MVRLILVEFFLVKNSIKLKLFSDIDQVDSFNLKEVCGILIQTPDTDGNILDLANLVQNAKSNGCLVAVATDLLACVLTKPPGEFGCDIAIGNSQRFGIPLNYGGPHAAFFSCKNEHMRNLPGRVVGLTKDITGHPALRLALQTREQHIRRDKATSNICTAQALLANMSAMYALYHGPEGLRKIAKSVYEKTAYLKNVLSLQSDLKVLNEDFFDTLKIKVENMNAIKERCTQRKVHLRIYDSHHVGVSLDETVTHKDIDNLIHVFCNSSSSSSSSIPAIKENMSRKNPLLTHPVFNSYHSETRLVRYMKQLENKDVSLVHSMIPLVGK